MKIEIKFNALTFLLGVNILVFILSLIIQFKFGGFDSRFFYMFGGEIPSKIYSGDWWLLITSGFFHIEILHFLINMFSLYRIGQIIMAYYDGKKLFFVFIMGTLGGSLLSYIVAYISGYDTYSLGASAGIFALIGLLLGGSMRKYRFGIELPFSPYDILPFVLVSFLFGITPGLNINNWAHIGGFVVGVILGLLLNHAMGMYETALEKFTTKLFYYSSILIFAISYVMLLVNAYNLIFK